MATTKTNPTKPVADEAQPVEEALPVGSVVRLPNHHDRYAIVVAYTDPVEAHTERDGNGREVLVEAVPQGHPLVLDLPGTPRVHQSGTERL